MSAQTRNNVTVMGEPDKPVMMFAHGFGCDSNMWRLVAPQFLDDFRIVLFDYVGHGSSDRGAYDEKKYSDLSGYASDVLEICEELDLVDVTFVGHSVSAMIGALAAIEQPWRFKDLVMIGPSPRYIDDDDYIGGFSEEQIDGLLDMLELNYLGWSESMAPVIMGNPEKPQLGQELTESFCSTDPVVARQFASVTFRSDHRAVLPIVDTPSLILQCTDDVIAPGAVGSYVQEQLPNSTLVVLSATGHCPHLSAPSETTAAIEEYLRDRISA